MSYTSEIVRTPKIALDLVRDFNSIDPMAFPYVQDYLEAIDEVDNYGNIILNDAIGAWTDSDNFAKFLTPYVETTNIERLIFQGEEGEIWRYFYIDGKMYDENDFINANNACILYDKWAKKGVICEESNNVISPIHWFVYGLRCAWSLERR